MLRGPVAAQIARVLIFCLSIFVWSAPAGATGDTLDRLDDAALRNAERDTSNWLSHGRTYSEQRYSPLTQINDRNIRKLKLAWEFKTGLTRGHEATPIVIDGVMYFTGSWSVIFAVNAVTGELIWKHDPQVPKETAIKACCDVVNRGVAAYRGRIYSATLDGRLLALDGKTGEVVWEVVTVDQSKPYTVTGAPRIVKGRVIIGNGGAEFGVRGYFSAYHAGTGKMVWRTYTVPGDPAAGFESKAMETAAATWSGGEWWKVGGGGTAWDSIAYDAALNLLYVGTGNGSPWTRHARSPGGGDNLYLSSILAVDPDSGEIQWHYQTTPGDTWDFTATQHMILADFTIGGEARKVIMQAPKNGFFYVIDRTNGELISAEKYVTATWAERVDPETGRPMEVPGQDFKDGLAVVKPTPFGGHNWQPMSFNPKTGLVYIPAQEISGIYRRASDYEYTPGHWNTGTDFNVYSLLTRKVASGHLLAWDPIQQKEVWRHPYAVPWNGGTLTTGGNLVFQGTADGRFIALDAENGKQLWEDHAGTGVVAAPVTFIADGKQYISVVAGWGGAFALAGGETAKAPNVGAAGRLLTFALFDDSNPPNEDIEKLLTAEGQLQDGERLYHKYCAVCHGASGVAGGTSIPDLRHTTVPYSAFDVIVRQGTLLSEGMPGFGEYLTSDGTRLIKDYLEHKAKAEGSP
jgi:quinohemoprotein ethanol dehydrogenase